MEKFTIDSFELILVKLSLHLLVVIKLIQCLYGNTEHHTISVHYFLE